MKKIKKAKNYNNQELNFSLIVMVLVCFCFFMLVVATFTQLKIFTISNWSLKQTGYIPQIPMVLFTAGLLGKRYGTVSIILYILTGLFLVPVFALGGGLDYILNFNFGYILGFIPAVYFAARLISENISALRLFLANLTGITLIHVIGLTYMVITLLIEKENIQTILNWAMAQSFNNLLIDVLFGYAAISLGNFIKTVLKKIA